MDLSKYDFNKLPKSFGIKGFGDPRWYVFIEIMNSIRGINFNGNDIYGYYGIDVYGNYNTYRDPYVFEQILTVNEFFNLIEIPKEIINYEIF
jgi:hypothetical protein